VEIKNPAKTIPRIKGNAISLSKTIPIRKGKNIVKAPKSIVIKLVFLITYS